MRVYIRRRDVFAEEAVVVWEKPGPGAGTLASM
jgi:hypothetical protein